MNPWDLDATGLLAWGIVAHLIADWPLQNDWMAKHKAERRNRALSPGWLGWLPGGARWWDRHPAAYVHAGIHGLLLALVFGWFALPVAVAHLLIDTRKPVVWFSRLMRQTQPRREYALTLHDEAYVEDAARFLAAMRRTAALYDVGTEVRFWTDQAWHIACIALAALVVAA